MTADVSLSADVRFSITCHPARRGVAEELVAALGADANVRMVDADPTIESTLDTLGRALAPDGETCRYEVVLCDDASLSDTFADSLVALLRSVTPGSIVSLFTPAHSETAALGRVLWVGNGPGLYPVADAYVPTTGMVMCRETATEASSHLRAQFGLGNWRADDRILHEYARKEGVTKLVSLPNLVDHDRYPSRSLLGHDLPGLRRSTMFVDDTDCTAPEHWLPTSMPGAAEVVAPYLHWEGLTEQYVRWTEGHGASTCGPIDLIHGQSDRDLALIASADDSATLADFPCASCAPSVARHAARLGLSQRRMGTASHVAVDVPHILLESALFGATRKNHTREELESAVSGFVDRVREFQHKGS